MYKKLLLGSLLLTICPGNTFAESLRLGFNDFSAQIEARMPVQQDSYGFSEVSIRGLYNEKEDTLISSLGFDVYGSHTDETLDGIHFGAGAKVFGGETEEEEIVSVALGGLLRMSPTAWQGFELSASYFYGPQVFTTLDAQRLTEFQTAVDYEFIPKARVFIGYSNLQANFEDRDKRTIDESFRLGISLSY